MEPSAAQPRQLYRSITKRYGLAVLIIALLSTGAFYTLKTALSDSDSTAYIVNISGRQRMLSQHIALDAHRLHHQRFIDNEDDSTTRELLQAHIRDMRDANRQLTTGKLNNNQVVDLSLKIRQMYFGEMDLSQRVIHYIEFAEQVLNSDVSTQSRALVREIDARSEKLLRDLNAVVNQYQKEGEQRLDWISSLEMVVWMSTLFALLLEVLFIFRPMAREVVASKKSEQDTLNHLHDLVELRTFKLEQANKKLARLAGQDALTGLLNRLRLEGDIEKLIARHEQHRIPFAIAMLDLDWFKSINDNFGHPAGDYVLKEVAQILQSVVRESDRVYRSGGEEFVVILNRIDLGEAENKMELLRANVEKHDFVYEEQNINVTLSAGLYHSNIASPTTVHEIFKMTDEALYASKQHGRNRVTLVGQSVAIGRDDSGMTQIEFESADLLKPNSIKGDKSLVFGQSGTLPDSHTFSWKELLYPPDLDCLSQLQDSAAKGLNLFITARLKKYDGGVAIHRLDLLCDDCCFTVIIQRVTELANAFGPELLVTSFNAMMENTSDFIYFKDRHHVFIAGSESLVDMTNVNNRQEFVGKTDYEVFPQELADDYYELEKRIFTGKSDIAQKIQPSRSKSGEQIWVDNRKFPMKDSRGNIVGLFGIARTISGDEYQRLSDADV